jgi:sugar phosphate permease
MRPLHALIEFFRERPAAPPLEDPGEVDRRYRRLRTRMLWGSIVAYGLYYFTRKNISVALPLLSRDLGYSNRQLGVLGSLLYVSYAVSKASFGLLADRVDPRRFMTVGLTLSALINICFGLSTALFTLGAFWFVNGIFHATGAPPSAKICVRWFSVSERGTKWGLWNISHQAGGGLILVIAGAFASLFGWRAAFLGPALICIAGALFILLVLRDRPESLGLPPIEVYRDDPEIEEGKKQGAEASSFSRLFVRRVLLNPQLLLIALGSMCVYVVRYGTLDWTTKYLVEVKGQKIARAGPISSLIEFVGIPGMLLAGLISDRFFDARRAPICVFYMLGLAAACGGFYFVPGGHDLLDAVAVSAIGFFTYGPQMLLAGVAAADACGAQVAAAAVGITGLMSYIGAIISSLGTGVLIDSYGWGGAFLLWIGCSVIGALLILPLWRTRGRTR